MQFVAQLLLCIFVIWLIHDYIALSFSLSRIISPTSTNVIRIGMDEKFVLGFWQCVQIKNFRNDFYVKILDKNRHLNKINDAKFQSPCVSVYFCNRYISSTKEMAYNILALAIKRDICASSRDFISNNNFWKLSWKFFFRPSLIARRHKCVVSMSGSQNRSFFL